MKKRPHCQLFSSKNSSIENSYIFTKHVNHHTIWIWGLHPTFCQAVLVLEAQPIFVVARPDFSHFFHTPVRKDFRPICSFGAHWPKIGLFQPASIEFVSKCRQEVHLRYDSKRQTSLYIYNRRNWQPF